MSRTVNWVLLQLAMSYYGDSLKEFQVDNDQLFINLNIVYFLIIFMKLLTQFSIPNPSKADLAKTNNRTSKTVKKVAKQ